MLLDVPFLKFQITTDLNWVKASDVLSKMLKELIWKIYTAKCNGIGVLWYTDQDPQPVKKELKPPPFTNFIFKVYSWEPMTETKIGNFLSRTPPILLLSGNLVSLLILLTLPMLQLALLNFSLLVLHPLMSDLRLRLTSHSKLVQVLPVLTLSAYVFHMKLPLCTMVVGQDP